MNKRAAMGVVCAWVAFGGCGGSSDRASSGSGDGDLSAASFQACPSTAWTGGGGEDWEVRGVTCEAVGRFVFRHFEPHPGGTTQTAAGFNCDVQQYEGEYSPLHVRCSADDGRAFRFVFS
jgi:hypothetical protein